MRSHPELPALIFLAATLGVTLGAMGCEAAPPPPTPSTAVTAVSAAASVVAPAEEPADGAMVWVERVPEGEAADAPLPLVVAIHGLGDAPDRFCRLFDDFRAKARVACPRAFSRHGRAGWSWFPVRTDAATQARDIGAAADRLAVAIEALRARRGAPAGVVVTGFSQGGALSLALAVRHPGLLTLAVPLGGWLPEGLHPTLGPAEGASTRKGPSVAPIEALHGEADERIAPGPTRDLVTALAAGGANASFRAFPGVGHALPPEVRSAAFAAIERGLDAGRKTRQGEGP